MPKYQLLHGNCFEELKNMPDNSITTIITDPPYGLGEIKDIGGLLGEWIDKGVHSDSKTSGKGFLSKEWDKSVPPPIIWKEIYRVLKPGGTALVFAGTRTFDLMALSMKLAGFKHKDTIIYLYGSGFPKARDIAKSIDGKLGVTPTIVSEVTTKSGGMARVNKANVEQGHRPSNYNEHGNIYQVTTATSDEAKKWQGYKSHCLKPAYEPILMMMKPNEGSYADSALKHGVAGLNMGECRVEYQDEADKASATPQGKCTAKSGALAGKIQHDGGRSEFERPEQRGRFPANIILDDSEEVQNEFDKYGTTSSGAMKRQVEGYDSKNHTGFIKGVSNPQNQHGDAGSVSRFFYSAKASQADRTCNGKVENKHPTVKNRELMRYLVRLTKTPSGGSVLDPFMGSGSTIVACVLEGVSAIGVELEQESYVTAEQRVKVTLEEVKNPDFDKKPQRKSKPVKKKDCSELDMFD